LDEEPGNDCLHFRVSSILLLAAITNQDFLFATAQFVIFYH